MTYAQTIATRLQLQIRQVENTIKLLESGATVPFIARYRKEQTGELDEVQIVQIRDLWQKIKEVDKRREFIITTIEEAGKLTEALKEQLLAAETLSELEDLYLPYKPKRKTRATQAIEKGLEPLANKIAQQQNSPTPEQMAMAFIDESKGVADEQEALSGARDILAERMNEDRQARLRMRVYFEKHAVLFANPKRGIDPEIQTNYSSWYEWKEPATKAPSHRLLAIFRGENEDILSVKLRPEEDEKAINALAPLFIKARNAAAKQMELALADAYKRLLAPAMETELRAKLKEQADKTAIDIFAENLRQLLMASPLGEKPVIAIDPGFRTGCKTICLNAQGDPLEYETLYFHSSVRDEKEAKAKLEQMVATYHVEAIAIGNGTAGRETEFVVSQCQFSHQVTVIMVNESGASIYSACESAREEFPEYDLTVRGAISIGRRLMDPLAELVKIDPKSIGVGQYQHDVNQTLLQKSLTDVVESCVNQVGVELNTASKELLSCVSGVGDKTAKQIVDFRQQNGAFSNREELKKVPKLGAKTFEQCAGFLRIRGAKNPLDGSAVHPERYEVVEKMAAAAGCTVETLMTNKSLRQVINIQDFVSPECGLPTLKDILAELDKPGRDPRTKFEPMQFNKDITRIEDLYEGLVLQGVITNITAFGAFVDIGVHQDGLVHVSQMANKFIREPAQVVKLNQQVKVKVLEVDLHRKRISLSMKNVDENNIP